MLVTAAYTPQLGATSLIRYGEIDIPDPGPGDVLIAVHAVSVNPVDTFVRSGRFATRVDLPLVLGRDAVGTVMAAPEDSGLEGGQWVWVNSLGYEGRQGSSADLIVVPRERVYALPEGVQPEAAVSLAHPASTAALAFAKIPVGPGSVVFIGGGGGNVGTAALTLASACGARVITTAGAKDADRARAAGAQVVIDHHDPGAPAALREELAGGADLVWDTSGRMDYGLLSDLVAAGGQILVTAAGPDPAPVPWAQLYTRDVTIRGFAHSRANAAELARAARTVNHLLARGLLAARITEVLPLAEAALAHDLMESGHLRGRILLRP